MSGFRDKALKAKLEELGAKVTTSISSNTDYLIVKDKNANTSKINKAKEIGVKIINIPKI